MVNTQKQPQNPPNYPEIPHNDDGDNSKSSAESALIQNSKTPEESEQIPVSEPQKETEGKCLTHWNSPGDFPPTSSKISSQSASRSMQNFGGPSTFEMY